VGVVFPPVVLNPVDALGPGGLLSSADNLSLASANEMATVHPFRLESQYSGPNPIRSRRVRLLVDTGPSFPVTLAPDFDRFSVRKRAATIARLAADAHTALAAIKAVRRL
jgi:hypothetical protein